MPAKIDLVGQKFNRLLVLKEIPRKNPKKIRYLCQCDCGQLKEVNGVNLREGTVKSCGCLKKESDHKSKGNAIDLTGQIFHKLTVIERAGSSSDGQALWKCQCACGSKPIIVYSSNLRKGHTTSCGCERRSHGEIIVEKLLKENNISFISEYSPFKYSNGHIAKFDFYVDNKYLIEYDGETHYQANLHGWHTSSQLQAQLERDAIKNQWCKKNNIPLIRIPYYILNNLTIEDLLLETTKYLVKD